MPEDKDSDSAEANAFVVVEHQRTRQVVALSEAAPIEVSGQANATLRLTKDAGEKRGFRVSWRNGQASLEPFEGVFLNGKPVTTATPLKPGDELQCGDMAGVLGISAAPRAGGRRALTHDEFKERLYEELARATRSGRPTSLVMLKAKHLEARGVTDLALRLFRAGDVIGSYAPDEPELLFPDCSKEVAEQITRRLLSEADIAAEFSVVCAPHDGHHPERLLREARRASSTLSAAIERPEPSGPVTQDPSTEALISALKKEADTGQSILLTGEVSTGKSVFARYVHNCSASDGAFFIVRCATLEEAVISDSVFQHIESLGRGTIFLDDVGELGLEDQARLLSAIKNNPDLRIISGTQRTLAGLVERRAFNKKLYEKLADVPFEVPPLRARPEDILPLARSFAEEVLASTQKTTEPNFSLGAIARIRSYPWPGNLLELRNAIERAVVLAAGGPILAEHLPNEPVSISAQEGRLREHVDSVERDAIIKALADTNHNQTHTAKRLGISRRALIYKMEKYGLKRPPKAARKS